MNKKFFLFAAAIVLMFAACSSDANGIISDEEVESTSANEISVIYENEYSNLQYEDFERIGSLHNEFLDDMIEKVGLISLTSDDKLVLEKQIFNDYVFQNMVDFMQQNRLITTMEERAACNLFWTASYDLERQIDLLVSEYGYLWADFFLLLNVDDTEMNINDAEEIANTLFEDAWNVCSSNGIDEVEYNLLSTLAITKYSIEYWTENKIDNYMTAFQLTDPELRNGNKWWRADARGAFAGLFTGSIWGVLVCAAIASVVAIINDICFNTIVTNYEDGDIWNISENLIIFQSLTVENNYLLYDATHIETNPYMTSEYLTMELPLDLYY